MEMVTMKISQLLITDTIRVETQTDAIYLISSEAERFRYMVSFGDVRTVWDAEFGVFRVPAFATKIEKYTEKKMRDCARYGCE
jgi:hypothetical protein|tara:strand:- start:300 stop:548 length:249 start_codon:yes stop_codon:yes gene_type:complete